MPEYARICQSMPEYARVCQSVPEYARVCQSMPEYARVCQSMTEYARVCQSMPEYARAGLHKLWYPGIRDTSTWSKFGAHGEHGDVFGEPCSGFRRTVLWFLENRALALGEKQAYIC